MTRLASLVDIHQTPIMVDIKKSQQHVKLPRRNLESLIVRTQDVSAEVMDTVITDDMLLSDMSYQHAVFKKKFFPPPAIINFPRRRFLQHMRARSHL